MKYKIPTKAQLLKLQKIHETDQSIGDVFGVTRQTVHHWRLKYGIKSLRDRMEARNYLIKKDFTKSRIPAKKLATKYRLSLSHIYRTLKSF